MNKKKTKDRSTWKSWICLETMKFEEEILDNSSFYFKIPVLSF